MHSSILSHSSSSNLSRPRRPLRRIFDVTAFAALVSLLPTVAAHAGIGGSQPEFPLTADCWVEPDTFDCRWVGPNVEFVPPNGAVIVLDGFRSTQTLPYSRFRFLVDFGPFAAQARVMDGRLVKSGDTDPLPEFRFGEIDEKDDSVAGELRGDWRELEFEALTVHPGDVELSVALAVQFSRDVGPEDRDDVLRALRFAYANIDADGAVDQLRLAPAIPDTDDTRFIYSFGRPFPDQFLRPAGSTSNGTVRCYVRTENNPTADGIQAWSVGLRATNAQVDGITVDGTAGDLVANGGYRSAGFEFSETMNGDAATSAVVLSFALPNMLPPNGQELTAFVDISFDHPAAGQCYPIHLNYVDGLQGSGDPVDNVVVFQDTSINPIKLNDGFQVCGSRENWVTYDANGDAAMNMSDGVAHLASLFSGGPSPLCEEAMDFNGDSQLNIADPVGLFSFMFLGGPPPVEGLGCSVYPTCPTNCQ
ncbi:MAG: hypothetical protein AAF517_03160 [Planctomycetota bacterium]